MKSGDARVALIGFPSVGKVSVCLALLQVILTQVEYKQVFLSTKQVITGLVSRGVGL